jgi:hypothetical protein
MDCRVKPGNDEREVSRHGKGRRWITMTWRDLGLRRQASIAAASN